MLTRRFFKKSRDRQDGRDLQRCSSLQLSARFGGEVQHQLLRLDVAAPLTDVLLRDQGRVQQPDRRLRHQRADDRPARRLSPAHGDRQTSANRRRGGPRRPRVAISSTKLSGRLAHRRATRMGRRSLALRRESSPASGHPPRAARTEPPKLTGGRIPKGSYVTGHHDRVQPQRGWLPTRAGESCW